LSKLPQESDRKGWTPAQTALMQQLGLVDRTGYNGRQAPDAPRGVIESFLMQCQRTQLDPTARQIYCIERGGKWGVQISIDGFRLIADRSKGYRGQTPAQWTKDGVTWVDVWLSDDPPAAARVGVFREGFEGPQYAVATFAGYCPRDRDGSLAPRNQWLTNPSNQLAKCAEMLALRKAFPNELSGLYGTEEMDQASTGASAPKAVSKHAQATAQTAREPERRAPSRDWLADAKVCRSKDELRKVYQAAQEAGDLNIALADGTPLGKWLFDLREALPDHTPAEPEAAKEIVEGEIVDGGTGEVSDWPTAEIPNGEAA
jgi:phage recombination protein Bet